MRQFLLECLVDLPDNVFKQVDIVSTIKTPWETLMKDLESGGNDFTYKAEIIESQKKPATTGAKRGRKPTGQPTAPTGAKRGRKPKLVQPVSAPSTRPVAPPWDTEAGAAE